MQETCGLGAKVTENINGLPCKVSGTVPDYDSSALNDGRKSRKDESLLIMDRWNFVGLVN